MKPSHKGMYVALITLGASVYCNVTANSSTPNPPADIDDDSDMATGPTEPTYCGWYFSISAVAGGSFTERGAGYAVAAAEASVSGIASGSASASVSTSSYAEDTDSDSDSGGPVLLGPNDTLDLDLDAVAAAT